MSEPESQFLKYVIPAAAAIIGSLLTYFSTKKKVAHDVEDRFRDDVLREVAELRKRNDDLTSKNEILVREIAKLKTELKLIEREWSIKIALFESAHSDLPLPMWLKDEKGKMLALNDAYERQFLRPFGLSKSDYLNHYDSDVWPQEIAEQFLKHDTKVLESGQVWEGVELVPDPDDERILQKWQIVKYLRTSAGIKIGIGGIAVKITGEKQIAT